MIPLHSLLAISDYIKYVPKAGMIICAVILLIAFIVGFAKGFRKINWGAAAGLLALLLFIFADKWLKGVGYVAKLPLPSTLQNVDPIVMTSILLAFASALVMLILYGVCTLLFRPRWKWVTKNPKAKRGHIEYENDDAEVETGEVQRRLVWKNAGTPTIFGRFIGAFVCLINTAALLAGTLAVILLLLGKTPLANQSWVAEILGDAMVAKAYEYACLYAFDFFMIGVVITIAGKGYKKGLLSSITSLVLAFGGIVLFALGFYIPFSPLAGNEKLKFIGGFVEKGKGLMTRIPKLGEYEMLVDVGGKLLTGAIFAVILVVIYFVIKYVLVKCGKMVKEVAPFRVLDGAVAGLLYFVVGIAICVAVLALFYVAEYCGFFSISGWIADGSLVDGLYDICGGLLNPVLGKVNPV